MKGSRPAGTPQSRHPTGALLSVISSLAHMAIKLDKKKFGRVNNTDVWIWHLESRTVGISVISYGATLSSVRSLNKEGKKEVVSLGFDSLEPYVGAHPYFGKLDYERASKINTHCW